MAAGDMPALARVRDCAARFLLDHGDAQRIGLAWEHVASGLSPERANRWSAVDFDPRTYVARLKPARTTPFAALLSARTVVVDCPYFDLKLAPQVQGVVGWGAHDPGTARMARPNGMLDEIQSRFGAYPAEAWIYGFAWPSAGRCRAMGEGLVEGVVARTRLAKWMLGERVPDWDLGLVVVSEIHSVIEGLWHGIDPAHPLHDMPSARSAGDGVRAVYRAVDGLIGQLVEAFPDAIVVVFALHGMGTNRSDVQSMLLLPELLYRHAFGCAALKTPESWAQSHEGLVIPDTEANWLVADLVTSHRTEARHFMRRATAKLRRTVGLSAPNRAALETDSMRWMPATRYQSYWRKMPAFALPSFYDGRIRINLVGREKHGCVPINAYHDVCDEIEALLRRCTDPCSGECVVQSIERPPRNDPRNLGVSEADLVVLWNAPTAAFEHPKHGRIGPVPLRRTGGHTGRFGFAYLSNAGLDVRDRGIRSAFDVVPTLVDLLGEEPRPDISGTSLLRSDRDGIPRSSLRAT